MEISSASAAFGSLAVTAAQPSPLPEPAIQHESIEFPRKPEHVCDMAHGAEIRESIEDAADCQAIKAADDQALLDERIAELGSQLDIWA